MKYNRKGAINYAQKYLIYGNPKYINYDRDNFTATTDCANFVSQCLHEGGGLALNEHFKYEKAGNKIKLCAGAQSLRLLFKRANAFEYEFLPNKEGLLEGDLLFKLEKGDGSKASRKACHVAIINNNENGILHIYQHGQNVKDETQYAKYVNSQWKAKDKDTIFCHIITDDEKSSKAVLDGDDGYLQRYGISTLKQSKQSNLYVKIMQEDLISLGYSFLLSSADGYFGPKTYAAVKAFQKDNGLKVDGLFGKQSKKALYRLTY